MHTRVLQTQLKCHWEQKVPPPFQWMPDRVHAFHVLQQLSVHALLMELPWCISAGVPCMLFQPFSCLCASRHQCSEYKRRQRNPVLSLTFLASNLYLAIMHLKVNVVTCPGDNICYCPVTSGCSLLERASLRAVSCDFMFPPSTLFL